MQSRRWMWSSIFFVCAASLFGCAPARLASKQTAPPHSRQIQQLANAIADGDQTRRNNAIQAIARLGQHALLPLQKNLQHPHWWTRHATIKALRALRPTPPRLSALLAQQLQRETHATNKRLLLESLAQSKQPQLVAPAILHALDDHDAFIQRTAIKALATLKHSTPRIHQVLIHKALHTYDRNKQRLIAQTIQALNLTTVPKAITTALSTLDNEQNLVAIMFLGHIPLASKQTLPTLIKTLRHRSPSVRLEALSSLALLKTRATNAVNAIAPFLQHSKLSFRIKAAYTLSQIGPNAAAALPALRQALQSPYVRQQHAVVYAIGNIGPNAANTADALLPKLKSWDDDLRASTTETLGKLKKRSPAIVKALLAVLQDHDPSIRSLAAQALGQIGAKQQHVKLALHKLSQDPNPLVRKRVRQALRQLHRHPSTLSASIR